MSRILLLLDHKENRRLLREYLAGRHEVLDRDGDSALAEMFDLCVVDGMTLDRLGERVDARRQMEGSAFLPFLLVTSRPEVSFVTRRLWTRIDEIIASPIHKRELQARIEVLLRARHQSLDLLRTTRDSEALVLALTHELRAPMRAISGYAEEISRFHGDGLTPDCRRYFDRIRWNSEQMRQLMESLLSFYQLDRADVLLRDVRLGEVVEDCVAALKDELDLTGAGVNVESPLPTVRGDPALLRIVVSNLLTNALKYVSDGGRARISVRAEVADGRCRVSVTDNGIGIDPADQERIFEPFVRLSADSRTPGLGLGLSSVRKAVQFLGGRLGVDSSPGLGSTFWFELAAGESR